MVHARGNSQGALAVLLEVAQEVDSRLSLSRLGILEQHLALALFPARTTGMLFSVFGAVGLYGVAIGDETGVPGQVTRPRWQTDRGRLACNRVGIARTFRHFTAVFLF